MAPGNGGVVAAGIKGNMKQNWDVDFTGTPIPGAHCTAALCASASGLLSTLFTGATYTNDWTEVGVYHAGRHGTWHDTQLPWPVNDTGDIN